MIKATDNSQTYWYCWLLGDIPPTFIAATIEESLVADDMHDMDPYLLSKRDL